MRLPEQGFKDETTEPAGDRGLCLSAAGGSPLILPFRECSPTGLLWEESAVWVSTGILSQETENPTGKSLSGCSCPPSSETETLSVTLDSSVHLVQHHRASSHHLD